MTGKIANAQEKQGHCPTCGGWRRAWIRGTFSRTEDDASDQVWQRTEHAILQCAGCDSVYHQTDMVFSEDMQPIYGDTEGAWDYFHTFKHWPPPSARRRPEWLERIALKDHDLYHLLDEVYSALDGELNVLAAIGIRTALDRASEVLEIDPNLSFAKKLEGLLQSGRIGETEKEFMEALTDAGSAAAHRGWRPEPEFLRTMMDVLEGFLQRHFDLADASRKLKAGVPKRSQKKPSSV